MWHDHSCEPMCSDCGAHARKCMQDVALAAQFCGSFASMWHGHVSLCIVIAARARTINVCSIGRVIGTVSVHGRPAASCRIYAMINKSYRPVCTRLVCAVLRRSYTCTRCEIWPYSRYPCLAASSPCSRGLASPSAQDELFVPRLRAQGSRRPAGR